jgi:hypothetical protein
MDLITFIDKVNNPELLAILQQYGDNEYLTAEQINAMRDAINFLNNNKFDKPNGTNGQYVRGDGSLAAFPSLLPALTAGSVLFSDGTTIAQDNDNLFYQNGRLGIGTKTPGARLDIRAQGDLSTDVAFRIRNSANTQDIIKVLGNQDVNFALSSGQSAGFGGASGARLFLNGHVAAWMSGNVMIYGYSQSGIQFRTLQITRLAIDEYGNTKANRLGVGVSTFQASAILQSDSTTQGFLKPRMTEAQRLAIASPATGLEVYQTDGVEGTYIKKAAGWQFAY